MIILKKLQFVLIVLIYLVIVVDLFTIFSKGNIPVEREGIILSKNFAGMWDGEDDDGNPTGGSINDVVVLYYDTNNFIKLGTLTVLEDISVGSKFDFSTKDLRGGTVNISRDILVLLLIIVNIIIIRMRVKETSKDS